MARFLICGWIGGLTLLLLVSGCESPTAEPSEHRAAPAPSRMEFVPAESFGPAEREDFASVKLRGYGTVSGVLWRFGQKDQNDESDQRASALAIACESPEKARILQAKFISDLGLLPGVARVKLATATGELPAWACEHQGWIAALSSGSDVLILSASSRERLDSLYSIGVKGDRGRITFEPQVQVPMYLERWDRFGFRFYNAAYDTPHGKSEKDYDFPAEFDFAAANGRAGPVIWTPVSALDESEGSVKEPSWDWMALAARKKMLPMALNLSIGPQTWLANRYRDQMAQKMPQYCGGFYRIASGYLGGEGWLSWSSTTAQDEALADLQQIVRRYKDYPNLVSWLEPHGELRHGEHDIFLEYGPVADATFRQFLRDKYSTPAAVSRRWFDDAGRIKSWEDIHVPEIASFCGWGPQAVDLSGEWRVLYQDPPQPASSGSANYPPFDPQWFAPTFDDSAAPLVEAPGNDRMMFLPRRPAVFRRRFEMNATWRQRHDRVWLYVWDLNGNLYGDLHGKNEVDVYLNGKQVANSPLVFAQPHWAGIDVSSELVAGRNDLAISSPLGYLAYRVYLSPDPPAQYPNLGQGKNAEWADFIDWLAATRVNGVRRGAEMIRQVDPDRQITFMSPDPFADGVKKVCAEFGGEFHDTGYMAGTWSDLDPLLAAGAGLPCSAEAGEPAHNLKDYRLYLARFLTEGVQAIDYYMGIGNVMWNPEIRREFERTQNLVHLVGKYHAPQAQTALLISDRAANLSRYPWGADANTALECGFWRWNLGEYLLPLCPRDGLTESDFLSGKVAKYRVVLDANTSIIDDDLLKGIENYVRGGGVFVTYAQTGRHSSTAYNSWPISRLSGYEVTHIDPYKPDGGSAVWHKLALAPGQTVFPPDYWKSGQNANGLALKKVAAESQDLMLWEDGSVAVGMRPLGKGFIIQVGAKFCDDRLGSGAEQTTRFLSDLLDRFQIARVPATAKDVMLRHFVTNNGLYDLWMLANLSERRQTTDLIFQSGLNPTACTEVLTSAAFAIDRDSHGSRLANLAIDPGEVRAFLTPRNQIDLAARDWFALQRNWWRGTTRPSGPPLPPPQMKLARDLTQDWAFQPITSDKMDVAAMMRPEYDDSKWERMRMGIFNYPDHRDVHHAVFRKAFTVPAEWSAGRVSLWLQSWSSTTFLGKGRVFFDGQLIRDFNDAGIADEDFSGRLKPGTKHTLAVEIVGSGTIIGSRGDCWLWYCPAPQATIDLAGRWVASQDALHYDTTLNLPGPWNAFTARRHITIDPKLATGRNVVLHVETSAPIVGVIANGHFVRRHHHRIGTRFDLNITPWVHLGEDNEIELVTWEKPGQGTVQDVSLRLYDPAVYP